MRVLGKDVINEMVILDSICGEKITIYYRTPSIQERQQWKASLFRRDGVEIHDETEEANLEWGARIMIGFSDGAFGVPDPNGNGLTPISSDPENEHYRADWRELIREFAPDFCVYFAERVFRGHTQLARPRPAREPYTAKN